MSTKRGKDWGAYEFTRSAYDEQRACEVTYLVQFKVELYTSFQRGVYRLRITSEPTFDHDAHLRHSIAVDFPQAQISTFEAVLYQQVYKLARMVEESYANACRQQTKLA